MKDLVRKLSYLVIVACFFLPKKSLTRSEVLVEIEKVFSEIFSQQYGFEVTVVLQLNDHLEAVAYNRIDVRVPGTVYLTAIKMKTRSPRSVFPEEQIWFVIKPTVLTMERHSLLPSPNGNNLTPV